MKKTILFLTAVALAGALPAGVDHWTAQQIKEHSQALSGKMQNGSASEVLANWGNHSLMIVRRTATGQAEFHEKQADIIIVRSGAGTMLLGGSVEGGKTTAPGEIRGSGIQGGEKQMLHVGDVVHVPPKTPHQVLLEPGETIDYFAIKVDAQ